MKPFKFRVWDNQLNLWSSQQFVLEKDGSMMVNGGWGEFEGVKQIRYEISYSTGFLSSPDDIVIFTGDIIRHTYCQEELIYIVEFDEGLGQFVGVLNNSDGDIYYPIYLMDGLIEIIGNKYENQELLND